MKQPAASATALPDGCSSNMLLDRLPPDDRAALAAAATRRALRTGDALGGPEPLAYFPESALLALVDRRGIELALAGRETMSGWSILFGGLDHDASGMVERSGTALALPVVALTGLCERSRPIRDAVWRSIELLAGQMAASASASAHYSIRARLARRLLMVHDRSCADGFEMLHARLAAALGVRRAGITDALHLLEGEHLLRCTRNRILVLDRAGLERVAGAAYGASERAYRNGAGAFGHWLAPTPA